MNPVDANTAAVVPPVRGGRLIGLGGLGLFGGVASAFFGIGGGMVFVPGLATIFRYPLKVAIACSLAALIPLALVGATAHEIHAWQVDSSGLIEIEHTLMIGGFGIVGAFFGVWLRKRINDLWLRRLFALVLLYGSYSLLNKAYDWHTGALDPTAHGLDVGIWVFGAIGIVVGIVSALFGIGGGGIIVPALMLIAGLPYQAAVATSLSTMPITGMGGVIFQRKLKQFHGRTAAALLPLATLGAIAGVFLVGWVQKQNRALGPALMGLLLIYVTVSMLRKAKPPKQKSEPTPPPKDDQPQE